ncbi:hypothetical protein BKA65DRAFT_491725 [Rhexocercosporidium sp. MPI-PUGE-AT-0058]|nr:hypothetical protein BKA65DRAFT_491725 [Rhexocercosporidium sp. MPI-PUGE-AT-0058]
MCTSWKSLGLLSSGSFSLSFCLSSPSYEMILIPSSLIRINLATLSATRTRSFSGGEEDEEQAGKPTSSRTQNVTLVTRLTHYIPTYCFYSLHFHLPRSRIRRAPFRDLSSIFDHQQSPEVAIVAHPLTTYSHMVPPASCPPTPSHELHQTNTD